VPTPADTGGERGNMVSITQLKQAMVTARLSDEGRVELEALLGDAPTLGVLILQEGLPMAEQFRRALHENLELPFAVLSAQDMAALDGLREQDSGIVLFSNGDGASVVPVFLVYNDGMDTPS